jgi:hypothetical protein
MGSCSSIAASEQSDTQQQATREGVDSLNRTSSSLGGVDSLPVEHHHHRRQSEESSPRQANLSNPQQTRSTSHAASSSKTTTTTVHSAPTSAVIAAAGSMGITGSTKIVSAQDDVIHAGGGAASPHHAASTNIASNTFLREVNSDDAFPSDPDASNRGVGGEGSVRVVDLSSSPTQQKHRRSSNPLQDSTNSVIVQPPQQVRDNSGISQQLESAASTTAATATVTGVSSYRRRRHTNISGNHEDGGRARRRRHTAVSSVGATVASGKAVDGSSFTSVAVRGSINPAHLYPSDDEDTDCWYRDTGAGGPPVEGDVNVAAHDEVVYVEQHHQPAPPISLPPLHHHHHHSQVSGGKDAVSQQSALQPQVSLSTSSPTTGELFASASPSVMPVGTGAFSSSSGHASPDMLGSALLRNQARPQPSDDPAAFQHVSSSMFVSGRLSLTTTEDATAYPLPQSPDRGGWSTGPAGGHHHTGGARVSASSSASINLPPHPPVSAPPPSSSTTVNVPPAVQHQHQQSFSASMSLLAGHRLSFESQSTRTDSSRPSQGSTVPPSIASTQIGVDGGDNSRSRVLSGGYGPHSSSSTTTMLNGATAASGILGSPPQTNAAPSHSAHNHRVLPSLGIGGGAARPASGVPVIDAIPPLQAVQLHKSDGNELTLSVLDGIDDDDDSRHARGSDGPAPIPSFCRP